MKILWTFYYLLNQLSTNEGSITDSAKVYAPVLGDFTIFMALLNLFDFVCKDATVFFAMTLTLFDLFYEDIQLFNFFMNGHSLQDRVEFFDF